MVGQQMFNNHFNLNAKYLLISNKLLVNILRDTSPTERCILKETSYHPLNE